jgi:hypothetical protein
VRDTDKIDIEKVLTKCADRRRDTIQISISRREAGLGGLVFEGDDRGGKETFS